MTNSLWMVCVVLAFVTPWGFAAKKYKKPIPKKKTQPNIIFILTDDLDNELGSPLVLNKTRKLIMEGGAEFTNTFVTTPMCCPSRSSILTGTYVHNNHVFSNNNNCSGPAWRKGPETRSIGKYLHEAGYMTGYFGKYLNEYYGKYIPPGWRRWYGLIKNSRYYNYHINNNGTPEYHKNIYAKDYLTDLIANKSLAFFSKSKMVKPNRPVMMMLSVPAPHGPEDGAPQYQHMFPNATVPRTPHWNINSPDKHWIIRNTFPMDKQKIAFQDLLHRKRLQTLLSVDDLVHRVYKLVKDMGLLSETYFVFTSDHGYHLGQYGLVKGKSMPYEMDIKVPFYIRGPAIPKNIKMNQIIANIDWAPTLLDMANVPVPPHMDGLSIMKLFTNTPKKRLRRKQPITWRDTVIIERGKPWRFVKKNNSTLKTRRKSGEERSQLFRVCSLPVYQSPCKTGQIWECKLTNSRPRFKKCKVEQTPPTPPPVKQVCTCFRKRKTGAIDKYTVIKDLEFSRINRQSTDSDDGEKGSGTEQIVSEYPKEEATWMTQDNQVTTDVRAHQRTKSKKRSSRKVLKSRSSRKLQSYYKKPGYTEKMIMSGKDPLPDVVGVRLIKLKAKIADTRLRLENLRERRKKLVQAVNVQPEEYCQCRNETVLVQEKRKKGRSGSKVRLTDNHKLHPLLRVQMEEKTKKGKGKGKTKRAGSCDIPGLNCFQQTNDHWKVAPLWTGGNFCFCPNTNNNTYDCLRTINKTHNFLYCEFVTNFTEYFDLKTDPYQLHNTVVSLPLGVIDQLHYALVNLRGCKGQQECFYSNGKLTLPSPPPPTTVQPTISQKSTTSHEVSSGRKEPATGNTEPATGNTEPATGNMEPSAGNTKPATGNVKLAAGNTKHTTGTVKPSMSSFFEEDVSKELNTLPGKGFVHIKSGANDPLRLEDLVVMETTEQPDSGK